MVLVAYKLNSAKESRINPVASDFSPCHCTRRLTGASTTQRNCRSIRAMRTQREAASRKLQRDFPTLEHQQGHGRAASRKQGIDRDRGGPDGSGHNLDSGPQLER